MATKPGMLDCEAVLSEMGWLKGLARGLGADPHAAEDLTQATFLTALENPPDTNRPVRGWLGTVLRNLFNEARRRRLRRESREARAAKPEWDRSSAGVLERAAIQKQVVDAVMALDEPYRTTVLLRFFEGLPPRKIAARTGTPVATVKTRLGRALEQLRSRLDRDHGGDRRAWLFCLLAPLPKVALQTSAIGVVIVEAKLKLAAAAAVVLVGVAGWFAFDRLSDDRRPTAPAGAPSGEAPAAKAPVTAATDGVAPIRPRSYVEPSETPQAAQPNAGAAGVVNAAETARTTARIRGRVIDTRSVPVAEVRVVFKPTKPKEGAPESAPATWSPTATSGSDGVFEVDAPRTSGAFSAQSSKHATVLVGNFDDQAPGIEPLIVVAPFRKVGGRVVDGDHRPLAGADVRVSLPQNFRAQFDRILDFSESARWNMTTDTEGRFASEEAPDVDGARIAARLEGWETHEDTLPAGASPDLEIVLRRTRPKRDTVTGQVVDHANGGVPDARVSTGDRTTKTDERGRFTIKIDPAKPPSSLIAVKEGFLPGFAKPAADEPVVLRLDGSPLTIEGKVVDEDQKPLAGIQVWTADPTFFASTEDGIQFTENVLSKRSGFWNPIKTADDGRFVLRGLNARDYRLNVMDPKTLALEEAVAVKAGSTDVVITLSGDDAHPTVSGTLVSLGGLPVPNAKVRPQRDTFTYRVDEGGRSTSHADTKGVVTDANGRFTLGGLPKKGVYLRIDGANILPREFGRGVGLEEAAKGQALDRLRIEVPVRCHLKIDLGSQPTLADAISVLDAAARPVPIDIFYGNGRRTTDHAEITDGRTSVLAVPENVTTVIFLKNLKEVDRKPVRLVPGQVTTVKL